MRNLNLILVVAALILIPAGIYFVLKRQSASKMRWYQTERPVKMDLKQYISATGKLQPQETITIGALVAGRVTKVLVEDNAFVKKDQVLVELDNGIGASAVKQAKATLMQAKANLTYLTAFYKRQKVLFEAGQLASDTFEGYTRDYENAKAAVLQAEGDLEIKEQEYNNLFIKAPENGIVIEKKVDLGQMVTAQFGATVLFTIAKDLKKMEAEIDVDEADVGLVKEKQTALFTVDAFPQTQFKSNVREVHYEFKTIDNVITYAVMLDVDNPELKLRPGMTTNVNICVASAKDALSVPNKSLRINRIMLKKVANKEGLGFVELPQSVETKTRESLWIMESNSKFKEVPVKLGVTDGRFTQVIEGVIPNMEIVIEAFDPARENPILAMGKLKV